MVVNVGYVEPTVYVPVPVVDVMLDVNPVKTVLFIEVPVPLIESTDSVIWLLSISVDGIVAALTKLNITPLSRVFVDVFLIAPYV